MDGPLGLYLFLAPFLELFRLFVCSFVSSYPGLFLFVLFYSILFYYHSFHVYLSFYERQKGVNSHEMGGGEGLGRVEARKTIIRICVYVYMYV